MKNYRYSLDKSLPTKLFYCAQCRKKTLKRYMDTETNTYLPKEVGRCNRENHCGYHYTAKQYFSEQGVGTSNKNEEVSIPYLPPPISFVAESLLEQTLRAYKHNHFIIYLQTIFPAEKVEALIKLYQIGTSKYWHGATVFWQRDINRKIRGGKIMLFDAEIGKRITKPFNHINWVHTVLKEKDFHLKQCLFGEHLLCKDKYNVIGIVESEKTAIIASGYVPDCIWLACGSLSQLTVSKVSVLKGRSIILYPDLGGYEKWVKQAEIIRNVGGLNIDVSDILEKEATKEERENGLDIEDYLIRQAYKQAEITYTHTELILSEMIRKNPIISQLIERFDIRNSQTFAAYRIKTV